MKEFCQKSTVRGRKYQVTRSSVDPHPCEAGSRPLAAFDTFWLFSFRWCRGVCVVRSSGPKPLELGLHQTFVAIAMSFARLQGALSYAVYQVSALHDDDS